MISKLYNWLNKHSPRALTSVAVAEVTFVLLLAIFNLLSTDIILQDELFDTLVCRQYVWCVSIVNSVTDVPAIIQLKNDVNYQCTIETHKKKNKKANQENL